MMNATAMLAADEILTQFDAKTFAGDEFSETYMREVIAADQQTFDAAVDYLCLVGLLAPTVVERKRGGRRCLEAGMRVL